VIFVLFNRISDTHNKTKQTYFYRRGLPLEVKIKKGEPVKTIINYSTGTGNSPASARSLCRHPGDCELVSIVLLDGTTCEIIPDADRV